MKTALKYTLGVLFTTLLSSQALACYTVYNRANQVLYHAAEPPIDMRYQIHQTLPARFPGGHMVFSITDSNCPAVNSPKGSSVTTAVNSLTSRNSYESELPMARQSTGADRRISP